MSPILKKLLPIFVLSMFVLMIAGSVYAEHTEERGFIPEPTGPDNTYTLCDFFQMIINIITWLWRFVAVLALVFIVVGGFMYIFSAGNPELMARAKNVLTWAIIGFVITLCAVLIINMVMQALGYDKADTWRQIELNCPTNTP